MTGHDTITSVTFHGTTKCNTMNVFQERLSRNLQRYRTVLYRIISYVYVFKQYHVSPDKTFSEPLLLQPNPHWRCCELGCVTSVTWKFLQNSINKYLQVMGNIYICHPCFRLFQVWPISSFQSRSSYKVVHQWPLRKVQRGGCPQSTGFKTISPIGKITQLFLRFHWTDEQLVYFWRDAHLQKHFIPHECEWFLDHRDPLQ